MNFDADRAIAVVRSLPRRIADRPQFAATFGVAFLLALVLLIRGKDIGWDFQNYHWYNPFAWLNGRREIDTAVAHHATYYNPLVDVPLYLAAQIFPSWFVGFLTGFMHGLNVVLLYALARITLPGDHAAAKWLAFALAVMGATGGMALILLGMSSQDLAMASLILVALLLLTRLPTDPTRALIFISLAGLAGGAAVGLKLTMAPCAIGLAAAVAALPGPLNTRARRIAALGAGGLLGTLIFGGFWMVTMWRETGNPLFPYFNDVFASPLILSESYRDTRFLPHGIGEALIYPFLFTWDGNRVNDYPFRDAKILLAYLWLIAAAAWAIWRWRKGEWRQPLTTNARLLIVFAIATYIVWVLIFAIYRYAIVLEMLAPILIMIAINQFPLDFRQRLAAVAATLVVAFLLIDWSPIIESGGRWKGDYVAVKVPEIHNPKTTMALIAGVEPMAYIIPEFPPDVAFLRIDGWLDSPQAHTAFGNKMRERVAKHEGSLFAIFFDWEYPRAKAAYADYGLSIDVYACRDITSNVGGPIRWCPLTRNPPSL